MPRKFSDLTTINMNDEYKDDTYVVGYYKKQNLQNDNSKINVKQFARTSDLNDAVDRITDLENGCLYKNKNNQQTVVGEVTFDNNVTINNNTMIVKSTDLVYNSNADKTIDLYWEDKNSTICGMDRLGTTANGEIYRNIRVKAHNSNTYGEIGLACDSNDEFYTYAPTPPLNSNDTNIATTEWVKSIKLYDLFDCKWSDHEINNASWLRSDTFSWQDGTVYSNAYNHLLNDISGKPVLTEIVGGYTIGYYLADDGHKIVGDNYENIINDLYNTTGIAWYYIIDVTNHRFKLPRTKFGFTGLRDNVGNYVLESLPQHAHNIEKTSNRGSLAHWNPNAGRVIDGLNEGGYIENTVITSQANNSSYQNNAPVQQRATQMYLYFYIGEYTESALQQTAGLNTSLFNGKVDLNLNNMNPSATAKETIVGWGMPDYSSAISLSTSTSSYTAPSNGFITFTAVGYNNAAFAYVDNVLVYQSNSGQSCSNTFPIKKGSVFTRHGGSEIVAITFIPCIGAEYVPPVTIPTYCYRSYDLGRYWYYYSENLYTNVIPSGTTLYYTSNVDVASDSSDLTSSLVTTANMNVERYSAGDISE